MEPVMELLDIHSDFGAFEDYFEMFEICAMTKEDDEDVNIVAHFLTFIEKEAYSLLRTLAMPEKPIALPYTTLKELLLDYFKYTNFECVQSVCNANVHLTASNIKSCNSDSTESSIHDDHLSLLTILKDSVESYSSSELNETQNPCKTTVSNQSIWQNSHVIVPDMTFPNDSHIFDEIPGKSEENMLSEHNYDRKRDVVLMDANFSNDPLLCNDILNEFHENILEKSNLDVISNIICPHNAFDPCEKPVQCEARVLNELDSDYNSDDFISTAVYPYHKSTSNVYSNHCEKYVLNEATLFITWGYKDPTLFRGGG
ncbi:unnamed protein product [Schistosoma curassoni]|uniref:Reverse transcriptase domain-containing protein n=1 Tax=Schistosoma curassoni TaxID=6186 RepID=A0A183KMI7_9TREM|nr:unnamed protein product [Schistosoma curassoni]